MINLKVNKCKFTIIQDGYTDCDQEGIANKGEVLGIGTFTIPAEHREIMVEYYGQEPHEIEAISIDAEEWLEGEDCNSYNADLLIHWLNAISHNLKKYTLNGYWEHLFWPVHDLMHAKKDFYGNYFSCSYQGELERFQDAYKICRQQGYYFEEEFLESLVDAYNTRTWGCDWKERRKGIDVNTIKKFNKTYV